MVALAAADRVALLLPQLKTAKQSAAAAAQAQALISDSTVSLQHLRDRKVSTKLAWLVCDKVKM